MNSGQYQIENFRGFHPPPIAAHSVPEQNYASNEQFIQQFKARQSAPTSANEVGNELQASH
jgi:hypothetical protein